MKKDKNNKTFSERFDEKFPKYNSLLSCHNEIKQFFISELKDIEKEFEKEAAEEMLICQKESQPTSRLTSLSNKFSEIIKKRI